MDAPFPSPRHAPSWGCGGVHAGIATQGDGGPLVNYINSNAYTIGYAKKRTAETRNAKIAALERSVGSKNFVYPSNAALQAAVSDIALPNTWGLSWYIISSFFSSSSCFSFVSFL